MKKKLRGCSYTYMEYSKFWRISLGHFIKYKSSISEEWYVTCFVLPQNPQKNRTIGEFSCEIFKNSQVLGLAVCLCRHGTLKKPQKVDMLWPGKNLVLIHNLTGEKCNFFAQNIKKNTFKHFILLCSGLESKKIVVSASKKKW